MRQTGVWSSSLGSSALLAFSRRAVSGSLHLELQTLEHERFFRFVAILT